MASSTPTNSTSVELLVFTPCVFEPEMDDQFPRVRNYHVWLFMSVCTTSEESILHTKFPDSSYPSISGMCMVALMYRTSLLSFPQSLVFGVLTRLHKKATVTCISSLALFAAYKNLATVLWDWSVSSSLRRGRSYT